jgi:hypothetical protein
MAACGGGGGGAVDKTRAVVFAGTVNLRGGDVPAMGTLVAGFETANGPHFGSCTSDLGASDEVVAVESPWFLRYRGQRRGRIYTVRARPPVEGVHSVVYVLRESGLASRDVGALRTGDAAACVQRLSVREASGRFIGREPRKCQIKALALPFPLAGVTGYGLRVRGKLAGATFHQRKRLAFYEDTFGFAVGPAEVVLYAEGVERPYPPAMERRALSLLYQRAKAHALS